MSSKKEIEKKLEEYRKNKKLSNNQSANAGVQSKDLLNQQDNKLLLPSNGLSQQYIGHTNAARPNHKLWFFTCFSKLLLWVVLYLLCLDMEVGAIFFIISAFFFMFSNLGLRRKGEKSAYSVFNKNYERINGTLTPEQLIYNS